MSSLTWEVGTRLTRDGKIYEITRITPSGAYGSAFSNGPTFHATIVVDGQVKRGGFTADIWSKSITYPTHAYTVLED